MIKHFRPEFEAHMEKRRRQSAVGSLQEYPRVGHLDEAA